MEVDIDGGGVYVDVGAEFYSKLGMVVVVCVLCWNYDVGAMDEKVLLRRTKTWVCGVDSIDNGGGDGDDFAARAILLRYDVADICSGKFANIANITVGDGVGVFGSGVGCSALGLGGGGLVY